MKVKFANKILEVLFTKEVAGQTMYAVEDEPNHIDWLINVEVVDAEKKELKKIDEIEELFRNSDVEVDSNEEGLIAATIKYKNEQKSVSEIPFGAKDSELQEASYHIPEGFHAEIDGNKVFIKKGEQKSTWSEEDEVRFQSCLNILQAKGIIGITETVNSKWLKSIKERYTWKPSDEQIRELGIVATGKGWFDKRPLREMYEQLKKLKGE